MDREKRLEKECESLYNEFKPLVIFIASLHLNDSSLIDDVVQETFLNFFSHINDIKDYKAYLTTVAKNESIKMNKNANKDISVESMDVFSVENLKEHRDLSVFINELNNILSSREINIILAHLYGGYTFKEIGEKFMMNEKTIKTIYYRALEKCKKEGLLR